MEWIYVFILIFGTIVGSFLNVVILRLNTGEPIVNARSKCFSCGAVLRWYELIPVLSFALQRGKCRSCGSKISAQYPLVEILTAGVFYAVYYKWLAQVSSVGSYWSLAWMLVFWALFIAIAGYDLRHKIIPDKLSYLMIVLAAFGKIFIVRQELASSFLLGVFIFVFFAVLWFVSSGRWLGLGDAKLFLGAGIFLGWPAGIIALFLSFWLGAAVGSIVAWKKSWTLKSEVPFAPFIFASTLAAFLWGEAIYSWYWSAAL